MHRETFSVEFKSWFSSEGLKSYDTNENIFMFLRFFHHCCVFRIFACLFRKAKLRQPTGQRLSNIRVQPKKISIGPILFLYYKESLVSSNLNSKQLSFMVLTDVIFGWGLFWWMYKEMNRMNQELLKLNECGKFRDNMRLM